MTINARAVLVVLAVGIFGCSAPDSFDRALRSSNVEEISDLRILMTKHGITYEDAVPENGMEGFSYRSADEPRIGLLRQKLNRQIAVKYKEPEAREYMQKLLTEMNHDFIVSERSDGIWIKWFPESDQDKEISMKVVQHVFAMQAKRGAADCQQSLAPSNSALEADARQNAPRAAQCGR
jgi:hypothetical protein